MVTFSIWKRSIVRDQTGPRALPYIREVPPSGHPPVRPDLNREDSW